jgi:putative transposase
VVTTNQRRAAVTHLRATYPVSERRACRLVRLARSRWQHRSRRPSDAPLAEALKAKAEARPRWGYRRLAVLLRREGWTVNLKRVLRVYRAEGLRVRTGRRRKQVSTLRVPRPLADGPNTQWTVDFIHDQLADGRRFRTLSVVDECTRECLALAVEASWPGAQVAAVLDCVARARGAPQRIVLDHGPELVGRALDAWAYGRGVELAFTRPGKPVDNCFVESFHDKFRSECLSTHWFLDLDDARRLVAAWREDYNAVRPHRALGYRTPAEYAATLHACPALESAHPTTPA